jgi:hypothetical protein
MANRGIETARQRVAEFREMAANQRQDTDDYRREAEQADDEADVQLGAEMIALAIATAEAFERVADEWQRHLPPEHKKEPRPPRGLGESPRHCQPAEGQTQ